MSEYMWPFPIPPESYQEYLRRLSKVTESISFDVLHKLNSSYCHVAVAVSGFQSASIIISTVPRLRQELDETIQSLIVETPWEIEDRHESRDRYVVKLTRVII